MKEIGERLKEARESIGVSIEEAAEDLKLRKEQIENIEEGNLEAFKDNFYLKYFIRDYSQYTSKISINDIKNAQKNQVVKKEEVRIASPYTASTEKRTNIFQIILYIILIIILIIITYFIITSLDEEKEEKPIEVAYRL